MKNINIKPRNEKGNGHGYWEIYWTNDSPMYKCFFNDGKKIYYQEIYPNRNKKINNKIFYI